MYLQYFFQSDLSFENAARKVEVDEDITDNSESVLPNVHSFIKEELVIEDSHYDDLKEVCILSEHYIYFCMLFS